MATPENCFWVACASWTLGAVYSEFAGVRSTFDVQFHDTYFVIAGIHLCLWLAIVFGAFGLFYHYNRWMGRRLGLIHFGMTFLGSLAFIWPYRGLAGMPRRYMDYSNYVPLGLYGIFGDVTTMLVVVGLVAQLVFLVNVVYSMVGGRKSVD